MQKLRLQKLIANAGICSRRKVEVLLKQNRITINGVPAQIGDKADPGLDVIRFDGKIINIQAETRVILLNKPAGVITSCYDPQRRKTVLDLLPSELKQGLHPIGRLDLNSRGALLLTNYGELTLRLSHPRYSHEKTYLVWLAGSISISNLIKWRNGLILNSKKTIKASVELLEKKKGMSYIKVIMKEGRNRQIRRIADLLGHPVIDLKRIRIGELNLNGLKEGHWRMLKDLEWKQFMKFKRPDKQI